MGPGADHAGERHRARSASPTRTRSTWPRRAGRTCSGAAATSTRRSRASPTGRDAWAPVRGLIAVPGERPYVKYDSDGESTIHIAFTNAHPNESGDVNIYYAAYRGGALRRADGTVIGPLGTAISPGAADLVFDAPQNAWIHDVAHDAQGRPVLVFASFEATSDARVFDHRYLYARWTGERWLTTPITAAGGSISDDTREPYYSGGITLDHEDPRTVYLSRQTGERRLGRRDLEHARRRRDAGRRSRSRRARARRTCGRCHRAACCRSRVT